MKDGQHYQWGADDIDTLQKAATTVFYERMGWGPKEPYKPIDTTPQRSDWASNDCGYTLEERIANKSIGAPPYYSIEFWLENKRRFQLPSPPWMQVHLHELDKKALATYENRMQTFADERRTWDNLLAEYPLLVDDLRWLLEGFGIKHTAALIGAISSRHIALELCVSHDEAQRLQELRDEYPELLPSNFIYRTENTL